MSNRRVKSLDYDDDDFDDYDVDDGYDADEQELTAEDKEQMRLGTTKVRELLGPAYAIKDSEIQEALWHYYYDIAKSVSYLKNQHKPRSTVKPVRHSEAKAVIPSVLPPKNFFIDCPWLQIPPHRRADIIIESPHHQGGLLGGASTADIKKHSKLAALRAKRRQQEKDNTTPEKPDEDYSENLSKLTLASTRTIQSKKKAFPNRSDTEQQDQTHNGLGEQGMEETAAEQGSSEPVADEQLGVVDRASPSAFAQTIASAEKAFCPQTDVHVQNSALLFDFTQPSPDDTISNAQAGKATPVTQPKSKEPSKAKADVANGLENLKLQDPVKIKSKNIDVISEYSKTKRKNAANFVVIGHVDAGKSTLMGRLLFDLKAIDQRTMEKYQREADQIGKGSFAFAWVLDQGSEERERGVTIDIAMNKFETEKTNFTILDAPGHQDFVPNMIAGASQADFAVLVVDASGGNFESGLRGQTKEHALLARSIGVQRIIVAVNKMDTIEWDQDRFNEIQQQVSAFLIGAGFQAKNLAFVPCSGLEGSNILSKAASPKASWYTGNTLVDELDLSEPGSYALDQPLRMTVADVFRGSIQNPLSISGRVEAGTAQVGEQIMIMPSGEQAYIKSLEVDDEPNEWVVAGQNVVFNLTDIDPVHLKTGDVVCSSANPIKNIDSFKAKILAFDSLTPQLVDVHRGRLHVPGRISQLLAILDKSSGAELKKRPKVTQPSTVVRVSVKVDDPVPLEAGQRIIFRAGGKTVAAGLIE